MRNAKQGRICRTVVIALMAVIIGSCGLVPSFYVYGADSDSPASQTQEAPPANDQAEEQSNDQAEGQSNEQAAEIADPVALIGETKYARLQEAIDAAQDGDTIVIQKDFKDYVTVSGKEITIDLNGKTWKAKGGSNIRFIKVTDKSKVTIAGGTLTGSRAKYEEEAALYNDGSQLDLVDVTVTGNNGEVIRNNDGILNIADSIFKGNYSASTDWFRYIVRSHGNNAKTTIANSQFTDNEMITGGTIYSYGSSYKNRSNNELNLISCDIKNNKVEGSNVYCDGNTHLRLEDTTISENEATDRDSSATPGLRIGYCWIEWIDSAVYNNKANPAVYAKDIYVFRPEYINGGYIPLPKDMKDHGKALTNYKMFDYRYGYEFTKPYDSSVSWLYTELGLEEDETTAAVAEYNGTEYPSVAKAVQAMEGKPGTVRIIKDAAISDTFDAHDGIIIDLDGHSVTTKSKSRPIFKINGGEVTIQNGTLTGGTAGQGSVIDASNTTFTVKDVGFIDNKNDAVYVRYGNQTEAARKKVDFTGCTFKNNGTNSGDYAISIAECDSNITDCVFDGNTGAIRMYEIGDDGAPTDFNITGCKFINGTDLQLESHLCPDSKATITDCEFTNNKLSNSKYLIRVGEGYSSSPRIGGSYLFKNCTISDNTDAEETTIAAETGEVTFENCLISNNKAGTAGAIEASPLCQLVLKDTVIKNNENTSIERSASGGVALRSASFIRMDVLTGGKEDQGFYAASLKMTGGALYGNNNPGTSPAAADLFVSYECEIQVPEVTAMKDGDYDFNGLVWKDDDKSEGETLPDVKNGSNRYYSVGVPMGVKQIYIDGVNGSDDNFGTREAPVKTMERATELANEYRSKCIMVLDTVTFAAGEKPVIDLKEVAVKRSKGFTGVLFDVAEGAELTVKNTVIDGNSEITAPSKGSLIKVEKGGNLVLDAGAVLKNNGYHTSYNNEHGGGVYCLGDMVMNNGALIHHNYAITGGGVCVEGGTFIMNGGAIDDNVALWRTGSSYGDSCGGGVAVTHGGYMEMRGGVISNNEGLKNGGGISLGTANPTSVKSRWATDLGISRLLMTGGTISGNKAYTAGGGIFVQNSTEATIVRGTIKDNIAEGNLWPRTGNNDPCYFAGGGIYVNGYHETGNSAFGLENGKLYLTNVEIADNYSKWEGGALAVCGAGSGTISDIKGTVIYDNFSRGDGSTTRQRNGVGPGWNGNYDVLFDNVSFTFDYDKWNWNPPYEMETLEYESYLSDRMLNGGLYNWTDENGDEVSAERINKINKHTVLNTEATASDPDVKESVAKATVHILGNVSDSNGGGIGCNGVMSIGQLPDYVDIEVNKNWNDSGHEGERPDSIKVDLMRDGELYESRVITADENGEWNTVFAELPEYHTTKNGEQTKDKYVYTIVEDMTYVPAGRDEIIGDRYESVSTENYEYKWEVVNAYNYVKPFEEEPEEPPKDEEKVKEVIETPSREVSTGAKVKDSEEVPMLKTNGGAVKDSRTSTGDESMLALAMLIMALAAGMIITMRNRARQ